MCGQPMKLLGESADGKLGDRWYCRKDDELYFPKEQHWGVYQAVVPAVPVVQKPPAPPVGEFAVWVPIVWLVGMIFLGLFFSWVGGLLGLVGATIYVHYDAKKYGVESQAALTLLLAIIGLPLYANELHKLRKAQQTGQVPTLVAADAPSVTAKPQPSVSGNVVAEDHGDKTKPTKFCRKCGAKISRDSKYCEECGTELIDAAASETPRELTSSVAHRKAWSKSRTIGLFLVFLIVVWAVFPVFVRDPSPTLLLTSTGSGGICTLKLQNRGPWPMAVDGYWTFAPAIQWIGDGPATHFTLMPLTAYTFEYRYFVGGFCARGDTPPSVTLVGEVRLLYRTYQVEIMSTNYRTG